MAFSEETIQQVWEKATPVAGNDPAVWRQDQCKAAQRKYLVGKF